jgi:hypothetical protein
MFLQTTLATEVHLAEGQFLLEEQETFNVYLAGTLRPTISKREDKVQVELSLCLIS